jgi:hypothetical protein
MKNVLKIKKNVNQPYLEYGIVLEEGDNPLIETETGSYKASIAASCFMRPGKDDTVLVSLDDDTACCYILAVLVRNSRDFPENDLYFKGNVNLHAEGGTLSLSASEGVSVATDRMSIAAREGEVAFGELTVSGSALSTEIGTIRTVAGKVEHIFQRFTERLIDAFRFVKDHEEVQTGSTRYVVETNLSMHSKNAMHTAEELVSINAEQINLC